jgi:mono/diheme cytochrome c family protein
MYSFAETPGTVNINPFSNAAFAATIDADPSTLPPTPDPALFKSISEHRRTAISSLRNKLAPLFSLYQTTKDPVDDDYEADHTGLDAMFDDVKISVSNGMIVVTNKETGTVIFTAPLNDINSGTFNNGNMPGQPGQVNGAALYTTNCSSCHGPLATSSKRGMTAAQIQSAIQSVGAMSSLSKLTAVQIQAIASALSSTVTSTPTPTTPATIDGAALYATDCSSCHGPLATSSKRGRTAAQIQSAIGSVSAMSQFSTLSTAQIQAIAAALATTPTPTPAPVACTYVYDVWGNCQANGNQTRNVLSSSPAGCTGTPVLTQSCTYVPPTAACTYTYDVWGACQSNGTQTRNVLTTTPSGCTGTPVTTQACTYVPPACTYTYDVWGACQSNNTQTRTVLSSSPAGCTGTPVLTQSCVYTPPTTVTLAQATASCTACHGLKVNTTVLKSGGYTVTGRTASAWLTTVNTMVGYGASLASGTTAQNYANFLAGLP